MKKINFFIFIIITIALILFDLYKASNASFTHDESFSFNYYVHTSIWDIISYKNPTPNNHILNTLLMKLSEACFGASTLTMRLPNIIAHLLFIVSTFLMINRFCNKNFIICFILINANLFLLDFFTLARGYGLAIGLMSLSFYFYSLYIENHKVKNHIYSLIFICFATLSNFALLNVFLIIILIHNIFLFYIDCKPVSFNSLWRANKFNLIALGIISIILYEPLRKISGQLLIDFKGMNGFWSDTFLSLSICFAYSAPYENYLLIIWQLFIITFFVLFILRCGKYITIRNSINLAQKYVLLMGMIVFFLIVSSFMQNYLFHTPFLSGRYAIFIYPIFLLMVVFLIVDLWNSSIKYLIRGGGIFISLVFLLHTFYMINTSSYYEWVYDSNTKMVVKKIKEDYEKHHFNSQKIIISNSWFYEPTINFYRTIYSMTYLEQATRNAINLDADYFYIQDKDTINLNDLNNYYSVIDRFANTNSIFLKQNISKTIVHIKAANNRFIRIDKTLSNSIIANGDNPWLWETFTLYHFKENKCALLSFENNFLSADIDHQKEITATRKKVDLWETFTLCKVDSNYYALRAYNNKYLSLDEKTMQIFAVGDSIGKLEKFEIINN